MNRRELLVRAGVAAPFLTLAACTANNLGLAPSRNPKQQAFDDALRALEAGSGGRLGVAVLDTGSQARLAWRGDELFPMASTFKLVAAGLVLQRVDEGRERLDRRIVYPKQELVEYSPMTELRVGGAGVRIDELCEAAVTLSDNTAANLLLKSFGGPAALTAYFRTLGDRVSRLDRFETELNEAAPGDVRDTTTPAAMLATMQRLVLGDALTPGSRARLATWLLGNKTGDRRLRAGFPPTWKVGDRTGSAANGTSNDVAVAWPPGRAPWLVTSYLTGATVAPAERDAVIAKVADLAVRSLA